MRLLRFLVPCLAVFLVAGIARAEAPRVALVTILDGDASVLRDGSRLALAEGVALHAGDLVSTGPATRLFRVEFPDATALALGPGTRALVSPRGDAGLAPALAYLLAGWAKLSAAPGIRAELRSAVLEADTRGGTAIVAAQADGARVFAETDALVVRPRAPGAAVLPLKAGEMLALDPAGIRPVRTASPTPAFVQAMPVAFRDSVPARAAAFQGKEVAPRLISAMTYADAQPWLDGEPVLRRLFVRQWRRLAGNPEFRRGLVAGLGAHPEWTPVLYPPPPPPAPAKPGPGAAPLH